MIHTPAMIGDRTLTHKEQILLLLIGRNESLCFGDQKESFIKHKQNFLKVIRPLGHAGLVLGYQRKLKNPRIATYYELSITGWALYKLIDNFNSKNSLPGASK